MMYGNYHGRFLAVAFWLPEPSCVAIYASYDHCLRSPINNRIKHILGVWQNAYE